MRGFDGQKISFRDYYPVYVPDVPSEGLVAQGVAVVGQSIEFPNTADLVTSLPPGTEALGVSLDFKKGAITAQYPVAAEGRTTAGGGASVVTLLDPYAPQISGVEIVATNIPRLINADISFDYRHLVLRVVGKVKLPSDQPAYIKLAVQFENSVNIKNEGHGRHTITGLDDNQQLYSFENDTMIGGGDHESFVFKSHFGKDEITDFIVSGSRHDVLSLSSTEFGTLTQVLQNTTDVDGNAVIQVSPYDTITLDGVTKAELATHPHDFRYHP